MKGLFTKTIKLLVLAAIISFSCACTDSAEKPADVTEITFSFWEPGMAHEIEDALTKVADSYTKLHPDVRIKLISQPVETYQDWIKSCIISDNLPDIQSNHGTTLQSQYNAGLIINISDKFNSESPYADGKVWKDTFKQEHIGSSFEDKFIPFFGTELGIFYNKAIYEKLGLSIPETWSEFMSNCKIIKETGTLPIAFMAQKGDACEWLEWAVAGGLFAKKHLENPNINVNRDIAVSSYETYRAILTGEVNFAKNKEYKDEYRTYISRLAEILQYCGDYPGFEESVAKAMFLSGEAAHIHSGSWDIMGMMKNDNIDFEVGIFKFPVFTEKETPYYGKELRNLSEQSVAVTKSAYSADGKLEKAIDFLQYFTSKDVYQQFINDTSQIPVVKDINYAEGTELFNFDGYAHDMLLIKNNDAEIIRAILSGNPPVLDDKFFERYQNELMTAAKKYADENNLTPENDYYMKETEEAENER